MKRFGERGSALLIVLGMLAFMVVSAVAFSAYMRAARLPSSYLRQTVASRLLVKAGLAEAINEIDAAIGNNVHPGIGNTRCRDWENPDQTNYEDYRNNWLGRVFIGQKDDSTSSTVQDHLRKQDETISTLTLEGLAYIPPPLVNEARYYGRRSNAAIWQNLPFDAGRYAFTAIDVSDFFDVNSLVAGDMRSSDPNGRISLSYLFENALHTSATGSNGNPDRWDSFMENFIGDSKVPLVSMADFNLALYSLGGSTGFKSPFCTYLNSGAASFYAGNGVKDEDDESADAVSRMTFVTDGVFTGLPENEKKTPDENYDKIDLFAKANQPFPSFTDFPSMVALVKGNLGNATITDRLLHGLCPLGLCMLYDYLDPNPYPLSLAMPSVERVPMICALQPEIKISALTVTPSSQDNPTSPTKVGDKGTRTVTYTLKGGLGVLQNGFNSTTKLLYPFRHQEPSIGTYKLDGRAIFFWTSDSDVMGLRPNNPTKGLFIDTSSFFSNSGEFKNGILSASFYNNESVSLPSTINQQQDALIPTQPGRLIGFPGEAGQDIGLFTVTYDITAISNPNPGPSAIWPSTLSATERATAVVTMGTDFAPLSSSGSSVPATVKTSLETAIKNGGDVRFSLNLALWARVKDSSDKTVDLVPACLADDATLNGSPNGSGVNAIMANYLGSYYPLMRFTTPIALKVAWDSTSMSVVVSDDSGTECSPTAAMVADPRYNDAPENWFAVSKANDWLANCHASDNDRDGDIFMSCSDQGMLQSVYEFANLPRLTNLYVDNNSYGGEMTGFYKNPSGYTKNDIPASFADVINKDVMWKTYDPIPKPSDRAYGGTKGVQVVTDDGTYYRDDFEGLGLVSGMTGPRVNPFSNNTNILMAAFANTPHEWRLACDSEDISGQQNAAFDDSSFAQKYVWNGYLSSSGAKVAWEVLEGVCGEFASQVHKVAGGNVSDPDEQYGFTANPAKIDGIWECAFDRMGWYDPQHTGDDASKWLCGVELDSDDQSRIWNTDRKFLYGYWRECFAARQQLFLIFVRAEPAMMGGGAVNQTPPQLGARAVALVWRDPTPTKAANIPHRTRVLFYRQLD